MKINDTQFTFARHVAFYCSIALIILSLLAISIKGFNLAVDFTGGVITEIQTDQDVTQDQLQMALKKIIPGAFSVTHYGSDSQWSIRQAISDQKIPEMALSMQHFDANFKIKILSSSIIGPQVGDELFELGGLAIMASLAAMLLYLSFRFEWRLATGDVVALFHDVIVILGLFSWLQIEFDLTVLAALLAIIGYSINDSIVISDRIREMLRSNMKGSLDELINYAIRSTLTRTLITSGTTLGTVSAIWFLAGPPLQGFSIALFVGIVIGTMSSVCFSATIPLFLGLKREHYQEPVETNLTLVEDY